MESLEGDILQALNALLEDQRANVEILVELASGATEVTERIACTTMGTEAVLVSCGLRERLTMLGAPVTRRINGIALHILDTERYDERLQAFARHQADVSERARSLLEALDERETRETLRELYDASVRGALWCEQRAAAFAQTRFLEFQANRPTLLKPRVPAPEVEPDARQDNDDSSREPGGAPSGNDAAPSADFPPHDGSDADNR